MYPSFYYIFRDLFGLELPFLDIIKTYGFFLALSFLAAGLWLHYYFKKMEFQGIFTPDRIKTSRGGPIKVSEVFMNALFGFLLGYKTVYLIQHFQLHLDMADILFTLQGSIVGGLIGALLFGVGFYLSHRSSATPEILRIEEDIYPHQRLTEMIMIAAFMGVLGSKIFASVEDWDNFIKDPMSSLLSFQGLTFYGGFIFAGIALVFYCRKRRMPFLHFLDATAPALILAYGIGRLGCHFSGDGDWGIVNTLQRPGWIPSFLWASSYPGNVAMEGIPIPGCKGLYCKQLIPAVFPTPLYEFMMCVLIFLLLARLSRSLRIPGLLFGIYLLFNGAERYLIEMIRINPDYNIGGSQLSQAQIIALALIAMGIGLTSYLLIKKPDWHYASTQK